MSMFKPAVKHEAKLRLAIAGPSGSGKTYTALAIATILAAGKPVALVDTEHGSAAKYADIFAFDVMEMLPPFHPDRFGEAIQEAARAGYGVIILDSLTHAWSGSGGMLDVIDEIAKRKAGGNSFAAWKDGTPIQNRLIDNIVGANIHVIATMRSKQDYVQDKDDRGKTVVKKVGMAAQQREGFEYEFDVVFDMDIDNNAIVSKTRAPALTGRVFPKPGKDVADMLAAWLHGVPAEVVSQVTPAPAPKAAPPPAPKPNGHTTPLQGAVEIAGDIDKARKAFHAQGVSVFGDDWNKARHSLIRRFTEKRTPANVRKSTNELTIAELAELRMALVNHPDAALARWQNEQAAQGERMAAALDAAAAAPEMSPDGNPFESVAA